MNLDTKIHLETNINLETAPNLAQIFFEQPKPPRFARIQYFLSLYAIVQKSNESKSKKRIWRRKIIWRQANYANYA